MFKDKKFGVFIERKIPEALSMLGYVGNFDSGLRIGKLCRVDNKKGYVIGGVSDNSSLVRVQDLDDSKQNE